MLPAHITPSEWILTGLIVGCVLLSVLAEIRPRKRDDDDGGDDDDSDRDLPLTV
jgi:hypothetical protein